MTKEDNIKVLSHVITGSATLCAIIAFLLLINYFQIRWSDPLESEVMTTLLERLENEPNNNALKEEIRNLDLMARKAFFNNQWQINTGALLLLISAIVLGFSINLRNKLRFQIDIPKQEKKNPSLSRAFAQNGIIIGGGICIFLALGAAVFTKDVLKDYRTGKVQMSTEEPETEHIEVITIRDPAEQIPETASASTKDKKSVAQDQESPAPVVNDTRLKPGNDYPDTETLSRHHVAFRGTFGNGISAHRNIPTSWDGVKGTNILWKTPLEKQGNNSPIIWEDRLFLSGADSEGLVIYCFNRHSGAILWKRKVEGISGSPAKPPKVTDDTGLSAPTLTTDGKQVYGIFATGAVICLDMQGEVMWSRHLGVPDNHYGHSSSLISWQGKLFVQFDTNAGGRVLALDCNTGKVLWDTKRNVKISWSSPILIPFAEGYQLILSSDPLVAAYDPDTGKELWSIDCMMGEVGPAPGYGAGLVFAANEYAKLVAIRPGLSAASIVWEDDEYLPEVASPVVSEGILFIATSYGVLAGYDAQLGDKLWEYECSSGFYASPVVADGKVFALDRDGGMHIFKVDRENVLLGEPGIGENTVATPAFAPGRIYIRGEENLFCIGKEDEN